MRRNIRISAVAKVGVSAKVLPGGRANVVVQIRGHRGCLVIRAREIVAEAARAGGPGDLGADRLGAADGGDVGTGAWERRRELWCPLAVVGLTRCTDACGVRQWNGRCRNHDRAARQKCTYLCRLKIREQRFLVIPIGQSCCRLDWRTSQVRSA